MSRVIQDKRVKIAVVIFMVAIMLCLISQPVYAADVSSVIESAWTAAKGQIKNVVNNVVFPIIDLVLAVFFFVKLGTAYFDCAPIMVL